MTKRAVAMMFALVGALAGPGAAHADPAAKASATATGMQSTGLLTIPATPTATVTQPPGGQQQREASIDQAAAPIKVRATSTVVAEADQESRIRTPVFPEMEDNARRRHFRVGTNNARAFAGAGQFVLTLTAGTATQLVEAASVRASAVARCEDNQAIFDTHFSVRGLKVLGRETPGDTVDLPIRLGLEPPLLLSVKQGEAGKLPGGGVFMNGLHITIPALDVDIVVGRAEAAMPTPCGVGKVAARPSRLGTPTPTTRPAAAGPPEQTGARGATLAASGERWPLLTLGVASAAVGSALYRLNRRARRAARPPKR